MNAPPPWQKPNAPVYPPPQWIEVTHLMWRCGGKCATLNEMKRPVCIICQAPAPPLRNALADV